MNKNSSRNLILSGELVKTVWLVAWPNIVAHLLNITNFLIDRFFLGRLGEGAIAIATSIWTYNWLFFGAAIGITIGTVAIVARSTGEGDLKSAETASRQSLLLGMMLALIFTFFSWLFTDQILSLLGIADELLKTARLYFQVSIWVSFFMYFLFSLQSTLRGLGDMLTPLKVMVVVNLLHIGLDYVLIFGLGGFTGMGVVGAAWAMVISRLLGCMVLFLLFAFYPDFKLYGGDFIPRLSWFLRILRLGSPLAIQNIVRNLGGLAFLAFLARTPESTYAVAALGVGLAVEGLAYMPGVGYAMAATTLVGQNLGAGEPERAEKSSWIAAWQGTILMTLVAILFSIFAYPIAKIYASQPKAIFLIATYLWINAPSEPFLALAIILSGALEGAGDTRVPALISIFTMWVLRLPLTYFLAITMGYGTLAAWVMMSLSTVIQGIWIALRFKGGKWKTATV